MKGSSGSERGKDGLDYRCHFRYHYQPFLTLIPFSFISLTVPSISLCDLVSSPSASLGRVPRAADGPLNGADGSQREVLRPDYPLRATSAQRHHPHQTNLRRRRQRLRRQRLEFLIFPFPAPTRRYSRPGIRLTRFWRSSPDGASLSVCLNA